MDRSIFTKEQIREFKEQERALLNEFTNRSEYCGDEEVVTYFISLDNYIREVDNKEIEYTYDGGADGYIEINGNKFRVYVGSGMDGIYLTWECKCE